MSEVQATCPFMGEAGIACMTNVDFATLLASMPIDPWFDDEGNSVEWSVPAATQEQSPMVRRLQLIELFTSRVWPELYSS